LKPNTILILSLAIFSIIDGYLLSTISLVGRAGISLFYTQYQFLKSFWKGALLVFIVWMILFTILVLIDKKVEKSKSNVIHSIFLIAAIGGLYFSYSDFRNSLSHKWLGEPFHLGVYLFWTGWIAITIFMLSKKKRVGDTTSAAEDL
jgi:hypothetical protein